jgi:mono/diheme cytochrome c family protein
MSKSFLQPWVFTPLLLILLLGTIHACGGGEGGGHPPMNMDHSPMGERGEAGQPAVGGAAPGEVDASLAARGEQLFTAKGCIGCHTVGGGRLTGPDLQGVTERRSYDWIVAMITNPDSMLRVDPVAKQLLGEYMTPMLNTNTTREEARAIYEYLRSK